jgi:hypothetical protein
MVGRMTTPLADYYSSLILMNEAEWTALAERDARDPSPLVSRFLESVTAVEGRNAIDEAFHPGRVPLLPPEQRGEINSTRDFVRHLCQEHSCRVNGADELGFRYVDYEIFPARKTAKEAREPRLSMDLLLANSKDNMPIVGEIKIGRDKPSYFALMQILMLAAEFQSAAQRERLRKYYPDENLTWPLQGPFVDVYVIVLKPPQKGAYRGRSFKATAELSERLMKDKGFAKVVRRIAYLEASAERESISFKKSFAFGGVL